MSCFGSYPQAVKSRAHAANMTSKMEEMRVDMDEANRAAEIAEKELKTAKHNFDEDLIEIKSNHEKRVIIQYYQCMSSFLDRFSINR